MLKSKIKPNTSAEYNRRINKALDFIKQNLDQPVRLDDVAGASHFSSYHFHRIFHAMVGETVNNYVSRKRMEKAAKRLTSSTNLSVTEIAEVGGFSSSANFSKAFKLYFGVSPSEFRNGYFQTPMIQNSIESKFSKQGKLYRKYGKDFNPEDLYSQFVTQSEVFDFDKSEDMLMQVKLEDRPENTIAYLTAPRGYELKSIFATWDQIIHWAESKGIKATLQKRFAFVHDNPLITPEDKCRYDAAIIINPDVEVEPPYIRSKMPAGKYAVAYFKDDADKINNFMTELCSKWFLNSGYEPDNHPPLFNYLNDSREDGYVEMNVYIKVKELEIS